MFERWCIQVNRSYADAPEYHIGSKTKICQMYDDMLREPDTFRETMKIKDKLSQKPTLTVQGGRFGFVPGKNIPITAVATYQLTGPISVPPSRNSKVFKRFLGTIVLLMVVWVAITAIASVHMERGLQTLESISKECYVTTENGKPRTINVFGETLWYDTKGEIVIPDQREITQYDARRFERPFKYCSVVSIDGIEPITN